MARYELSKEEIISLLEKVSHKLERCGLQGEIILFGGAVMTVVLDARKSTKDVDAIFHPPAAIRKIAAEIGREESVSETWLNDGVKGFVSEKGEHSLYYEDNNLKIFAASPEYVLAMKCMSMRLAESKDEEDVKFLIKKLNINNKEDIFDIVEKYYSGKQIPAKTQFAIEDILDNLPNQ